MIKLLLRTRAFGLVAALFIHSMAVSVASAESGQISWEGWRFNYSTDNAATGLTLSGVYYKDQQILYRASFPVMRVEYDNDDCGPYADILWEDTYLPIENNQPVPGCNGRSLCQRSYEQDGQKYLELGINAKLGEYDIYQSYVFNPNGFFDSFVFSRGLQCVVNHSHHAHWLFDFDINGDDNDQVLRNGNSVQTSEFNDRRSDTRFWSVQDARTRTRVEIYPGRDDGNPDAFSQWDVAVRTWKRHETGNWFWGPRGEIGNLFDNSENINQADIVFWYVTHLEHSALEGEELWHYSGPRVQVILP
ncbi:hypothetical protein AB833_16260 [Chromatiales bacterium (ex Bugula neritina AB1)]|nr:hypothetical protein AB833_16260 [Chromatiales bacterium (ex Bugula neritina AB1)]